MKISTKLVVMGLLALIGVGFLFLASYTSRTQIQNAIQIFIDRKEKLASIESMVDAIKDMQLVTMEALSERLHGPIDPTRVQEIGHLSKRLETTAAAVERKLTDPRDKKAYASLGPQVGLTLAAFRGDLLEYVRSVDWDQEKAEAVDNLIDENAGYLNDGLRHIQERLEKEVTAELANVHETLDTASTTESGLAAIVVLALLGGLLVIGRGITRSLNQLRGAMRQLADGDSEVTIPHQTASGEVGEMARTVQVFKVNAAEKLRLEQEQEETERLQRDTDAAQRRNEVAILDEVLAVTRAAAEGELHNRINLAGKDGFFGQLCQSVNDLLACTDAALQEVETVFAALAGGDLTRRVGNTYRGVFGRLGADVNTTVQRLREVVTTINQSSDQIFTAAREVASGSNELAKRTEQQAAGLEETAAAMEQLATSVRSNAGTAQTANRMAAEAKNLADCGSSEAEQAVNAMTEIASSSQRIGDIVSLIDDIAFQTNLLALNAAVEAARAGESGKGFAVVAQEVRSLAQRSATASKEIKGLVDESSNHVDKGVTKVNSAGGSLTALGEAIHRVADFIVRIAAVSQEQSSGIEQVTEAVGEMDETTQRNATMVEESATAARSLEEQASQLKELMRFFQLAA